VPSGANIQGMSDETIRKVITAAMAEFEAL
jgi:hypothetical protein